MLKNGDGKAYESRKDKCEAFITYNLITEPAEERPPVRRQPRQKLSEHTMTRLIQALKKTWNNSAPGPDRISWKLIKRIKDTRVGRVILEDIAQVVVNMDRMPEEWRGMKMVMISKPGKDHTAVKGWRPIVLTNTVGKLAKKLVAEELQKHKEL